MTSGMDCVAVTAALSAASGTLDPAPETPSSDKGAREGRVDEVDRNCRIVIDGPKNDTGKDGKSALPAVAFPARTAVLGVEQWGDRIGASHAFNSCRCHCPAALGQRRG